MTDLGAPEDQIDAILRASGPRLRTAVSHIAVSDFRRPRSRRRGWAIAIAAVVVLIVGLVAIGTNRNDQSLGNDPSRLHWLLTDLPAGLVPVQMSEPGDQSQTGPPGVTAMINVYATDASPLGPIVSVAGSLGLRDQDIVPAAAGTNFHETTIAGRRAAIADGESGRRLLYVEVDGHWVVLTSRNIDDATLTKMAQAVVRSADGSAAIPSADLVDGLTLVLPADAPLSELGLGSNFAGVSYGDPDGRSIGLQVYAPKPSASIKSARWVQLQQLALKFATPAALLFGAAIVLFGLSRWLRLSGRYRFPEFEVEPRLGGAHAAGVGAVISFASAAVPPASQRNQVPDYLRRA